MRLSPVIALLAAGALGVSALPANAERTSPYAPVDDSRQSTPQTSDGVRGEIAPPLAAFRRTPIVSEVETWPIRRGLTFSQWKQVDPRGKNRVYVATADLDVKRLRVRYLGASTVQRRHTVTTLAKRNEAIVGVNGDFFDIADLGAPWGVGVDGGAVLHGPARTPNAAMSIVGRTPTFGPVVVDAVMGGKHAVPVNRWNSPGLPRDQVGAYTARWGKTAGRRILLSAKPKRVREVHVQRGRVVSTSTRLSSGVTVKGHVLVGQGRGADRLKALKKGDRVRLSAAPTSPVDMAITSNAFLLLDGELVVTDDREMHPRTAVGYDADENLLFLVVVDGRTKRSRGMTMVELAGLLQGLGAESALNLDGGGSSTIVAPDATGVFGVRNRPSDGSERRVPNGVGIDLR